MEKLKNPGIHFKTDMTLYKLYFKMCVIYVSSAIYLLVLACVIYLLAILSDIQYELQVKQKLTIFLVQIYNCDVCMLHYFLRISHSMEELGDQCNVVFAGLLYRIKIMKCERHFLRGVYPCVLIHLV